MLEKQGLRGKRRFFVFNAIIAVQIFWIVIHSFPQTLFSAQEEDQKISQCQLVFGDDVRFFSIHLMMFRKETTDAFPNFDAFPILVEAPQDGCSLQ